MIGNIYIKKEINTMHNAHAHTNKYIDEKNLIEIESKQNGWFGVM